MTVLFTCNEFPPYPYGGLGIFVNEIADYLASKGHFVIIYGVYSAVNIRTEELNNNILVIRDPLKYPDTSLFNMLKNRKSFAFALNKLCHKYNVDVIEFHDTGAWFLFFKSYRPIFIRLHNSERYFKKRGILISLIERISFIKQNAQIIGISNYIIKKFKKHFWLRNLFNGYTVIYNGINIKDLNSQIKKEKIVVFAGTIKKVKGIDILLRAFIKSGLYNLGYKLHVYGKDTILNVEISYWSYLVKSIPQLNNLIQNGAITYYGHVNHNDLINYFHKAEICVFPSHFESFGLTVVEAMAAGAIVVYTNQGAAKEIINDGYDGFLVEPNDYAKLASKLLSISLLSEAKKDTIRHNAIRKAKFFSIENCAEKSIELYKSKIIK